MGGEGSIPQDFGRKYGGHLGLLWGCIGFIGGI